MCAHSFSTQHPRGPCAHTFSLFLNPQHLSVTDMTSHYEYSLQHGQKHDTGVTAIHDAHSPKKCRRVGSGLSFCATGCGTAVAAGPRCPGVCSTCVSSWSSGQCHAEDADRSQSRKLGLLSATSACSLRWNQSSMERLWRRRWRDLFRHMSWHQPATCTFRAFVIYTGFTCRQRCGVDCFSSHGLRLQRTASAFL